MNLILTTQTLFGYFSEVAQKYESLTQQPQIVKQQKRILINTKTTLVRNGKVIEGNLSQKHLHHFAKVPAEGMLK